MLGGNASCLKSPACQRNKKEQQHVDIESFQAQMQFKMLDRVLKIVPSCCNTALAHDWNASTARVSAEGASSRKSSGTCRQSQCKRVGDKLLKYQVGASGAHVGGSGIRSAAVPEQHQGLLCSEVFNGSQCCAIQVDDGGCPHVRVKRGKAVQPKDAHAGLQWQEAQNNKLCQDIHNLHSISDVSMIGGSKCNSIQFPRKQQQLSLMLSKVSWSQSRYSP